MNLVTDPQAIPDLVVRALRKQGKPSVDPDSTRCLYRAPDGSKCAAGHWLPDELYTPRMENRSIFSLSLNFHIPRAAASLLSDLQAAHDGLVDKRFDPAHDGWLQRFETRARHAAKRHDLVYPEN